MDRSHIKSKYSTRTAPKEFENLIKKINARYILVSYNNMGNKGASRSQAKISDTEINGNLYSRKERFKFLKPDFSQFTTGVHQI